MTEQAHEWVVIDSGEVYDGATEEMPYKGGTLVRTIVAYRVEGEIRLGWRYAVAMVFVPAEGKEPTP